MNEYDVIVVGAGAAGLIAAGRAAELGGKVLLLEKMERAGRKLLITGKGRCNITNDAPQSEFYDHIYPNARFLKHAFGTFFSHDIISLLEKNGLETVVERGGRVFPATNSSADVVNALLKWVNSSHVEIRYGQKVDRLILADGEAKGIDVDFGGRHSDILAKKIIICTGGCSYPATGSTGDGHRMAAKAGHSVETPRPALVPVETEGKLAQRLQGLSLKNVRAVVWVNGKKLKDEFGEMLFTHFGLTGPIILSLSRFVVDELMKKNFVEISVDLKPALDEVKLDKRLLRDLDENGKRKLENIFRLWLPSSMIPVFLEELGIDGQKEGHQVNGKERRKIMLMMKNLRFRVSGYRSFKEAIITAGGIPTSEIDSKTMESKVVKNLYFAGEVIDLDADTGGFNLQIAFSTAWLAAQSCMRQDDVTS
ncbi:MAG: NAD(P)/FAD-dependent oxidoreductase [Bacteroidetes bacterium]|nr:NAD(P)/FAD-dependent oxidoreductase [Bacteroidota bacterium]